MRKWRHFRAYRAKVLLGANPGLSCESRARSRKRPLSCESGARGQNPALRDPRKPKFSPARCARRPRKHDRDHPRESRLPPDPERTSGERSEPAKILPQTPILRDFAAYLAKVVHRMSTLSCESCAIFGRCLSCESGALPRTLLPTPAPLSSFSHSRLNSKHSTDYTVSGDTV